MQFYKVTDNEEYIRIEDREGSAATLHKEDRLGRILAICVPPKLRRQGIGTGLLEALEQEARSSGILEIGLDYPDSVEALDEFLDAAGYTRTSEAPILSVPLSGVLASEEVRKMLAYRVKGAKFRRIAELSLDETEELLSILTKHRIPIRYKDLAKVSGELSGVVYDAKHVPQACILCSCREETVHVELLTGLQVGNTPLIALALQGFLQAILQIKDRERIQSITTIASDEKTKALLAKVLAGEEPEQIGTVQHATKKLVASSGKGLQGTLGRTSRRGKGTSDSDGMGVLVLTEPDEDEAEFWRREAKRNALQLNILWKMDWQRHLHLTAAEEPEDLQRNGRESSIEKGTDVPESLQGRKMQKSVEVPMTESAGATRSKESEVME